MVHATCPKDVSSHMLTATTCIALSTLQYSKKWLNKHERETSNSAPVTQARQPT